MSKKQNFIVWGAVAAIGYLIWKSGKTPSNTTGGVNIAAQRSYLINAYGSEDNGNTGKKFAAMTDDEISTVYTFFKGYVERNSKVPSGTPLYNQLSLISTKYNIFT